MPHGEVVSLGISGVFSEQLPDGLLVANGPGDTADARAFRNLRQGIDDRLLRVALPVEQGALARREA